MREVTIYELGDIVIRKSSGARFVVKDAHVKTTAAEGEVTTRQTLRLQCLCCEEEITGVAASDYELEANE